ncbi:MAG: Tripartite tricarboxylate transporter TctA family protein [candidate division BRC1 bacterium ADurb.BinA364]|nr:MAG: Tripartite tricarboxylate transporter TctA family protein [candidate division BRC1 bacterium ADurb.BinA364]
MLICGLLLSNAMALVLRISQTVLMPIIAVLCVIGVFAYNNNPFHLTLVFFCGVAGYFFDKMSYSAAPLILGLILGNMADAYLRRALLLSHGNPLGLIDRPISFLLFLACALTVASQFGALERLKRRFGKSRAIPDARNK